MIGYTAVVDLHSRCHTVEVVDGVAVQRDADGEVVEVTDVSWVKPKRLGYPWDDHTTLEISNALADVIAAAKETRQNVEALRNACDMVLGEAHA